MGGEAALGMYSQYDLKEGLTDGVRLRTVVSRMGSITFTFLREIERESLGLELLLGISRRDHSNLRRRLSRGALVLIPRFLLMMMVR